MNGLCPLEEKLTASNDAVDVFPHPGVPVIRMFGRLRFDGLVGSAISTRSFNWRDIQVGPLTCWLCAALGICSG